MYVANKSVKNIEEYCFVPLQALWIYALSSGNSSSNGIFNSKILMFFGNISYGDSSTYFIQVCIWGIYIYTWPFLDFICFISNGFQFHPNFVFTMPMTCDLSINACYPVFLLLTVVAYASSEFFEKKIQNMLMRKNKSNRRQGNEMDAFIQTR